jgi:hypothetical protein
MCEQSHHWVCFSRRRAGGPGTSSRGGGNYGPRACLPICGKEHRFVLADAVWVGQHNQMWWLICPLVEPKQRFLVRVMSSSVGVALRQGEEVAAEVQLGKTWELGLT